MLFLESPDADTVLVNGLCVSLFGFCRRKRSVIPGYYPASLVSTRTLEIQVSLHDLRCSHAVVKYVKLLTLSRCAVSGFSVQVSQSALFCTENICSLLSFPFLFVMLSGLGQSGLKPRRCTVHVSRKSQVKLII